MKEPVKNKKYQDALEVLANSDDYHTQDIKNALNYLNAFKDGYLYAEQENLNQNRDE